jgi:hypothetical protein
MHVFTEPTPAGLAARTVVEVFVSAWEIECCAPPPIVGELSSWRLEFVAAGGRYPNAELDRDSTWLATRRPDGSIQLADGPVTALWAEHAGPAPGRVALRGYLYGNAHGPAPGERSGHHR